VARPIHYLMTARLLRPAVCWLYRLFDRPVTLGSGTPGATAARRAGGGRVVGVFRGRHLGRWALQPFRAGVALLALRAGVPVVPVAILGTRQALPPGTLRPHRAPIRVRVGTPLEVPESQEPALLVERIREAVAALAAG
jgi:1-acyl-sn-glycerol-3-phosphate acyltransferase